MRVLVVGASGATGSQLVRELLKRNIAVKIVVRENAKLPEDIRTHANLTIKEAGILSLSDNELFEYIKDCNAFASCLGHNLSIKGIFGNPKMLVTDAVKRICGAIKFNNPSTPVKFILMSTTAYSNKANNPKQSFKEKLVFALLRKVLPPQLDNERAAEYLINNIGEGNKIIQWSLVRPDSLINEDSVTEYKVFPSQIRSPIFDAGKTSRINVGHFMAELITNDHIWEKWKGKMPVIYNETKV
ncbi:MAG: NAD(P)H-binding protein [Ignavibacteriales bacterium]|nr:NAD(P)H-binding protein [Ignavibacteriales bacterium]